MTISKEAKAGSIVEIRESATMGRDLLEHARTRLADCKRTRWPSPKYRGRYVAFAQEILGLDPWDKQKEILDECGRVDRTAVSSGHKIGKSTCAAIIALCDYCAWDDARVVLTSTTSKQVDEILWREVAMLRSRSGLCLACVEENKRREEAGEHGLIERPCIHSARIDGEMGQLARTGLKSGFRQIYGFTAKEAEAVAGISGAHLTFIADEASGIPEIIFNAIEGNRAGGAKLIMWSNPTKNEGTFYEAFHAKASFWSTFIVSSEETPNAISGQKLIPGLATRDYIEEKKLEWGEKSATYSIRILGKFAKHEEGRIFSVHAIAESEQRWDDAPELGRLFIGVDVAGATGTGDESAFATRRDKKVLTIARARGLTEEGHLVRILSIIGKAERGRREASPVVVIDAEGPIGTKLAKLCRAYLEDNADAFVLVALRSSDGAVRQPAVYDRMRDELAANLEGWMSDGGAIPEDSKLTKELHCLKWIQTARNGKLKLISKIDIKKAIGYSPDTYDAVANACWEPLSLHEESPAAKAADRRRERATDDGFPDRALDPYAGADYWRGR